jgi:predicted ATPase
LSQKKDFDRYPDLYTLAFSYSKIKIYREWNFGRQNPIRGFQPTDARNDFLQEDCNNLGLILNQIRLNSSAKKRIQQALQALYEGITDFEANVHSGGVQVFLIEGENAIPATRLSDGTLRYLCLLAILCHPEPPPLVCIEEPELGLHPDVIPEIAKLLVEASEKCQLIVTTHSSELIDALSDHPEYVVVCSKEKGSTVLERLDKDALKTWLEKYSLGDLWSMGHLGGKRW